MNIILAYENLSAALWAAEAFTGLLRRSFEGQTTELSPWSFATLANPACRAQATDAATRADLIVIAASSGFKLLPAVVETWLGKCLSGPRRANGAVAAFFGHAHRPEAADSLRLQTVQRLAKEAGCQFLIPFTPEA